MQYSPAPDTVDYPPETREESRHGPPSAAIQIDVAARSHKGLVRPINEDNYLVARVGRFLQTMLTSLPDGQAPRDFEDIGYGMIVADGMGGMAGGAVASRMAITLFHKLVIETPDWIFDRSAPWMDEVIDRAAGRFRDVNEAIIEEAENWPTLRGMGTTLTMAVSLGADLFVAYVGDSPAYLARAGGLQKLTRDHTLARQLADTGVLDPRDITARFHHILTHAIGIKNAGGEPDIGRFWLADGDRLLLCSDGLTKMVDDATIAATLDCGSSSDEICQVLIDLALKSGGKDNVTAVLATYRIPDTP